MKKYLNQPGYIALSSILVIAAVVFTISLTTTYLSINEIQSSLSSKKNEETIDFVESCIEEGLLELNETNILPSTVTLPEGNCTITTNSNVGDDWDFTATGSIEEYTKSVQVNITRTNTITINSWIEI